MSSATLPAPPTSSGLVPEARHLVLPDGITSSGFPAVEETCRRIGVNFDPWQRALNRCILAKGPGGLYAADTVVMSIPRQVGKTFDVGGIVFADSIINPGTTTVWTAHRFKVARESFNELRALARSPKLAPHIDFDEITTAAGNECIPFRNGSRIVFAARERGAIRGFSKVRRIVLDEGQILTEAAMSDLAPTQNQATNPQIIVMGTPPKPSDPSEVFTTLRTEAMDGTSDGVLYAEFSADEDADLDDLAAWHGANPSLGVRTPISAIKRLRKLLSDDDFRREVLGIWDRDLGQAIPIEKWQALGVGTGEARPAPVVFAVEVSESREWASIHLAGHRPDGKIHVQQVEAARGTRWVAARLVELSKKWKPQAVAVNPGGPAGSLLGEIAEAGIDVTKVGGQELGQACGLFLDLVTDGAVAHASQPVLEIAVAAASKKRSGGSFTWSSKGGTDISPLWGVTLAVHVLGKPVKARSGVVW